MEREQDKLRVKQIMKKGTPDEISRAVRDYFDKYLKNLPRVSENKYSELTSPLLGL